MPKQTAEERKAKKRIADKKYYEKNKERIIARSMTYNKAHPAQKAKRERDHRVEVKKDPVAHEAYRARQKANNARCYAKHRDKILKYVKEYNTKNKDELYKKAKARKLRRVATGRTCEVERAITENIEKINAPPKVLGAVRVEVKTGNFILTF
jgi:hypothetical protein